MMKNIFVYYKIRVLTLMAVVLSACSSTTVKSEYASEILYTQLDRDSNISAWIFNVDDDKRWKIDDDLWARGWSPSGENILLDGNGATRQGQVWISSADGINLEKVFDATSYPDIAPFFPDKSIGFSHKSFWLTDEIILIQPEKGPIVLYDIVKKQIVEVREGAVLNDISTGGEYWIEVHPSTNQYFLASLNARSLPFAQYGLQYYDHQISPDGKNIAYSIKIDTVYHVAVSSISVRNGMHDEIILTTPLPSHSGGFRWNSSGKWLLYGYYDINVVQSKCAVVDISENREIYNQPCESKTDILLWSPRSDGFLTQPNLKEYFFYKLDGSVQSILEVDPTVGGAIQVVDWRLIEVP